MEIEKSRIRRLNLILLFDIQSWWTHFRKWITSKLPHQFRTNLPWNCMEKYEFTYRKSFEIWVLWINMELYWPMKSSDILRYLISYISKLLYLQQFFRFLTMLTAPILHQFIHDAPVGIGEDDLKNKEEIILIFRKSTSVSIRWQFILAQKGQIFNIFCSILILANLRCNLRGLDCSAPDGYPQ